MNSLEECLLFDYVEKLKYEQYGLNDFYWALDKQNKKQPHSHSHSHHHHDHNHSCADEEDHKGKKHDHNHHEHHDHHTHHDHQHHIAHSDTHHPSLCRPCNLPSTHVVKHDHSCHEHHKHEHHPASDSKASAEDRKTVMPETEQKLLSEFKSFAAEKISQNKEERRRQVTKQNKGFVAQLNQNSKPPSSSQI